MSFGFSAGDFITAGLLIEKIVSRLRAESVEEYNELILELYALRRTLSGIEHLRYRPGQEATANGLKVAALMCQIPSGSILCETTKI